MSVIYAFSVARPPVRAKLAAGASGIGAHEARSGADRRAAGTGAPGVGRERRSGTGAHGPVPPTPAVTRAAGVGRSDAPEPERLRRRCRRSRSSRPHVRRRRCRPRACIRTDPPGEPSAPRRAGAPTVGAARVPRSRSGWRRSMDPALPALRAVRVARHAVQTARNAVPAAPIASGRPPWRSADNAHYDISTGWDARDPLLAVSAQFQLSMRASRGDGAPSPVSTSDLRLRRNDAHLVLQWCMNSTGSRQPRCANSTIACSPS